MKDTEKQLVIVFPSYVGKPEAVQLSLTFTRTLVEMYPDAIVVPAINGGSDDVMGDVYRQMSGISDDNKVRSVISTPGNHAGAGVVVALLNAYEYIMGWRLQDYVVVRLDDKEHPVEWVERLAIKAEEIGGVAIGDLDFAGTHMLMEDSVDEFIHTRIFPEMYGAASDGAFRVSCAHGYNAYSGEHFAAIVREAERVVDSAEDILGEPPAWGIDGAMALSAAKLGFNVEIIPIPAMTPRNRTNDKIVSQFRMNLAMCLAAQRS